MSGNDAREEEIAEAEADLAGDTLLVEAGHPTAANGQCPVCYSEGYEEGEEVAREQAQVLVKALTIIANAYPYAIDLPAIARAALAASQAARKEGVKR